MKRGDLMPEKDKTDRIMNERSPSLLTDEELNSVIGGYQVVFRDSGMNRDSWFVSYVTRRMVQDSIRQELDRSPGAAPGEISVRGRAYSLTQVGDNIYVEQKP